MEERLDVIFSVVLVLLSDFGILVGMLLDHGPEGTFFIEVLVNVVLVHLNSKVAFYISLVFREKTQ